MIKTFRLPQNWKLVIDTSQVYRDDPGAGTPALVHSPKSRSIATFWCVMGTAECEYEQVPDSVMTALEKVWGEVDELLAQ